MSKRLKTGARGGIRGLEFVGIPAGCAESRFSPVASAAKVVEGTIGKPGAIMKNAIHDLSWYKGLNQGAC